MYFKLAWRNIWRNTRRTGVIMAAVIIGVWSMVFLGALMRGMMVDMLENGISTLTGDIQIHYKGYRDDPSIENSMDGFRVLSRLKKHLPTGAVWAPRVRVNAVASNARHSSGIAMVGIEPSREKNISFIGEAVYKGRYLKSDDTYQIIVGEALVDKFESGLGKKLVLMSQDKNGEIASKAFRIVGVFRAEMESTEKRFVFVTMPAAQKMLGMKKSISEISISWPGHRESPEIVGAIKSELSSQEYEIHTWRELLPMLTAYINIFDSFMYIWYLVTFIAMGFGIVNTTLMAIFERMREFGILKALGMKPWWIVREVLTECFLLLILGMISGNILAFFCSAALSGNGIDLSVFAAGAEYAGMSSVIYPVISAKDLFIANSFVLFLGLLVCLYPAVKAARIMPVEAMAHT